MAGHVPFSEIGDIAKIEWRFEEPAIVTGKNDTKNGTKITTREKSPDPQKGKMQSQPGAENMEQDPFFKKSDSEKVEKKTTKEDFSFGDANNVPHQSNGKQDRDPFFNN